MNNDTIQTTQTPGLTERQALYQALSVLDDALTDGYHSRKPLPVFAPDEVQTDADDRPKDFQPGQNQYQGAPKISQPDFGDPAALASEIMRCRACRLAVTRKQVIPGTGQAGALLFILGEYPSDELSPGLPFSADAGQLISRMLAAIGIDRGRDCFETTAVKCRPPMDHDPAPDEVSACLPFLQRQILAVRPKAILAFGRISAQMLLESKDGLLRIRGTVHSWRGIPLVATYHPEAILKDESLKRPAWEDLKLLKTVLGDA